MCGIWKVYCAGYIMCIPYRYSTLRCSFFAMLFHVAIVRVCPYLRPPCAHGWRREGAAYGEWVVASICVYCTYRFHVTIAT